MNRLLRLLKYLKSHENDKAPKTKADYEKALRLGQRFNNRLRKTMPNYALRSDDWRSAVAWYKDIHNAERVADPNIYSDWCGKPAPSKIYVAQIGFFVLAFVEEQGRLRLYAASSYIE